MADLGEIESLQERIARIEKMVKQIQGELGLEQKGSGLVGEEKEKAKGPAEGSATDEKDASEEG